MEAKTRLRLAGVVFTVVTFFGLPVVTQAASFGISPGAVTTKSGETFTVTVSVSSSDEPLNVVSGTLAFPTNLLEVVSVFQSSSVVDLWIKEPAFSNGGGSVSFEGGVYNPGFTGSGALITITFKALAAGTGTLSFVDGSILANDGKATNILTGYSSTTITVQSVATVTEVDEPAVTEALDSETTEDVDADESIEESPASLGNSLKITSPSHPDQSGWYSNNAPLFTWSLPNDAFEVRTIISHSAFATPTVRYSPPISQLQLETLEDGTYYFAVQALTNEGWGEVSRYQINIDTSPPEPFTITFPHGILGSDPQPVLLFNTSDSLSGVVTYEIKIGDGGLLARWSPPTDSNPYVLSPQEPGTYTVTVVAMDAAGNTTTDSKIFTIESIEAPIITRYPSELMTGDILKIRGTTYPNSDATILIREKGKLVSEESARSDETGDFTAVVTKRLTPGKYVFTAKVTDPRGAVSRESEPHEIRLRSHLLSDLVEFVQDYALLLLFVAAVFLGVIVIIAAIWHHTARFVHRPRRRGSIAAGTVSSQAFDGLDKHIKSRISRVKTSKVQDSRTADEIAFLAGLDHLLAAAKKRVDK